MAVNKKTKIVKRALSKVRSNKSRKTKIKDSEYQDMFVGNHPFFRDSVRVNSIKESYDSNLDFLYEKKNDRVVPKDHFDSSAASSNELFKKHQELENHYHEDHYSDEERRAIGNYCDDSSEINENLYKRKPLSSEDIAHTYHLDNACKKKQTPTDMHVYSGIGFSPARFKKKNQLDPIKVRLKAYTSTSIRHSVGEAFSQSDYNDSDARRMTEHGSVQNHNHVLKIHVPKGSHGAYVAHMSSIAAENEFLLKRGSYLHIHPTPEYKTNERGKPLAIWHAKLVHDGVKETRHMDDKTTERLKKFAEKMKNEK
jgi:ADP-ribosyltransferase exoenzyme